MACRPCVPTTGPGQIGAVHEVVAKALVGVHHPHDVVLRSGLRLHGDLSLDLLVTRIGVARSGRQVIDLVADDLATEARGRALDHCDIVLIGRRVALHHEPARPFLPDQILPKRVGAHRVAGNDVKHVRAAIFLTQAVGARANIHDDRILGLGQIGNGDADPRARDRR